MKKNKYIITLSREDLAIYYYCEYGPKQANNLMKEIKQHSKEQYYVQELMSDCYQTKRETENFATRIREYVISVKAIKTKEFNHSITINIVKI